MPEVRMVVVREQKALFASPVEDWEMELDGILEQWARYVRTRRPGPSTCASAEKFYRIDERSHRYPHLRATPQVLESHRALMNEVDRAVRSLPEVERELLKAHYVERSDPRRTCRRLVIHKSHYGSRLHVARCMVRNVLRRNGIDWTA